ncbi:tRNA lysidine(34) synthetase TilS [Thermobifida fusca]|uniref:tRNA(Ile)-lysidine synthase n=2 Tax=Thermobifida fusca TaxID=2021 RepID=TILS_THEFY|nr:MULTISPECIES: tRNA lysidine(34) synthetase TilS [Thermobifida]Q47KU2.1 RecName: Full=tRNA(Ile)-lysidine synthase; AltName: Full=tRNA(Ile)-2-lysyl-cytidine synthase; AltName: Full=tRNA(Ile)-lysidine synthetase [Thermobifida fusca YX]AAZ56930.1 helix-turn-helix, Fis-type [Thermobifida fusca YX]EOR70043.1 Fis family transcriptional regulator [Thermobifida fusca TM51]MBO2529988.1 tRNA lysidine(34) synthetase TilS [Thermobifida sp.]MDD6792817.1 tRNA lysidine(34) synthetase TilS [Thermobifida fus
MSGPPPPVALVRTAVRRALRDLPAGSLVLVACSGGPDSLALAGATAFVAPRLGLRAGGVTVDHGLQEGSAERADTVAALLRNLGFDPVERVSVTVGTAGGPEAAARSARYAALEKTADVHQAAAVLLGHTRDDQAETVLLRLARGSGARSLAAMATRTGRYLRPFLDVDRRTVHEAASLMGFEPWSDPHNTDPAYTRSRVRHEALPVLERVLGPGITEALARTATLLRDDADALDAWADQAQQQVGRGPTALDAAGLAGLPRAIRTRLLRRIALAAGCPAGALTAEHVFALDRLVTEWRGQSHVDLPGARRGRRHDGQIIVSAD